MRRDDVHEVVKQFGPAEPDEEYVAEYEAEGHIPEAKARETQLRVPGNVRV